MRKREKKFIKCSKVNSWICYNLLNYKILIIISMIIIAEKILVYKYINTSNYLYKNILDILLTLIIVLPILYVVIKSRIEFMYSEENIKKAAYHDILTGLPNRALLKEEFNKAFMKIERNNENLLVMFLDLNDFKTINDTLGHEVGDKVIQAVAKRLQNSIRETDTVCRLGGDEFVILFPNVKDEDNIDKIAIKIIDVFKNPFSINGNKIIITTSIGVSLAPKDGKSLTVLIKNADLAMYKAKKFKKNNYEIYHSYMSTEADNKLEIKLSEFNYAASK